MRTRRKRKMRRKKKSGISLVLLLAALIPIAEAGKKKSAPDAYALVSGTVFHEPGIALPGAEVFLIPSPPQDAPPVKIKRLQSVSDARGEFAFRVPPASMKYTVKVAAKGYKEEEKSVSIQGEERAEVTFMLREESK
jgi:hypothetical protein